MDNADLSKALRRLLILIAKKVRKKLLPSALQDNKILHILQKGEHMINDPAQLADLAIKQ